MRAIHLARSARDRYGLGPKDLRRTGALAIDDIVVARRVADRLNLARATGRAEAPPTVSGGELVALATLHEILHHVLRAAGGTGRGDAVRGALAAVDRQPGRDRVEAVRTAFEGEFGGPDGQPPGHPRRERRGAAGRAAVLEELVLLAVTNDNPAVAPLRDLVDDRLLRERTPYLDVLAAAEAALDRVGPDASTATGRGGLATLLRSPAAAAPTSLAGQLRWIRAHWADLLAGLPGLEDRLLFAIDVLAEEDAAIHRRFGPAGPDGGPTEVPSLEGLDAEPEAFSADTDWMPSVVLQAKSTHVWLEQLSRRHGREIRTLDGIPDEELDRLAGWGISGLWLIGLWQRSAASAEIKRRRGDADAHASAYAVDEYRIADDLGGDAAWANLRGRAASRGIRLAADMVPNHMGIDSRWVVENPERFLSLDRPPFPAYSFEGPDLSPDPRLEIVLEDHYWDDSDAAVVFRRTDRATGSTRFVYHGNDGTAIPWNDTAQLDYSQAAVRDAVIAAIVDVARRFPIIRFDAAMVLARRHIRRLWFPEPGAGGAIPSRADHALSRGAFDAAMPGEFWRDVVDRVANEVPGTLLLAEAFWLLEGYFVRTLGMHRVYNSAFMHMLRNEDGPGFRKLIRDTLEFDPQILQRYVNFMSNPDEQPAIAQFGAGDKYFGAATVLATLPGLPMLAHGQIEGLGERYGHEFRRPRLDEAADPAVIERHEREIVPLLRQRARFAGAAGFRLYEVRTDRGAVDEHVFAYSNGHGADRSLVVYHDRFASTTGWIRDSVPFATIGSDGSKTRQRQGLADALGLSSDAGRAVALRDERSGLTWLTTAGDLRDRGLRLELGAYACRVFLDVHELPDGDDRWSRLARRLDGRPVADLEAALRELALEPVHDALRSLPADAIRWLAEALGSGAAPNEAPGRAALDGVEGGIQALFGEVAVVVAAAGVPSTAAALGRTRLATAIERRPRSAIVRAALADPNARAAILGWLLVGPIGGGSVAGRRFERLSLTAPLAAALRPIVAADPDAWAAAERAGRLLGAAGADAADDRLRAALESWLAPAVPRRAPVRPRGSRGAGAAGAACRSRSSTRGGPGS
jgi:glycosidase